MSLLRSTLVVVAILSAGNRSYSQAPITERTTRSEHSLAFVVEDFKKLTRVPFRRPTNSTETVIQRFRVGDPFRRDPGTDVYFAISFTVPEWLDGDVKLNFFHLNPEAQSRRRVGFVSSMFTEGAKYLPHHIQRVDPDETNEFWRRYPFTRRVYAVTIERKNLQPGQSYALVLSHFEPTPPDIALALTIDSERGRREYGSLSYMSGPIGISGLAKVEPLTAFIQNHWTNFPMVKFLQPTNGIETVFQDFKTRENMIGEYYSGVRFTVPEWLDGDLGIAFIHRYRSQEELHRRPGYSWGVVAERGEFHGLEKTERVFFEKLPEMRALYPFTEKGYLVTARRYSFVPGKTYVFWWGHRWEGDERVLPDLALAFTIASERGRREHGEITWR